jgi:FAD/FMN-containing dehydrogenase
VNRRTFLLRSSQAALAAAAGGAMPAWAATHAGDPALAALAKKLRGTIVTPGSAGYAQARRLENTRFDRIRPRAIVFCADAADVQRTVDWATTRGIHIVPRSGGHSYGGYSTTTGVVVDVSRLNHIAVSADKRTARIGAGARLIDVYAALWQHGLTLPGGSCASVGIAGLALGGGIGFAGRKLGLTADNLRALRLVTADAHAVVADASANGDLYWASRGGGGGNFGIATDLTFRVHPVSTVATFTLAWPWSQASDVVHAWQAFAPHAPDALFSICDLLATDPGTPGAHAHVVSSGQFFGSQRDLQTTLRPLLRTGTPSVTTRTHSYIDAVLLWAGCSGQTVAECHPSPRGTIGRSTFAAKSDYAVRPLSSRAIEVLINAIDERQAHAQLGRGAILMDAYGGAINRVPARATAFVHRDALFGFQHLAEWDPGAPASRVAANEAWLRRLQTSLAPHVSGFAYQNYIDPTLAHWSHAYYGSNYARLQQIKLKHDPENVFHFAQSIRRAS